MAFDKMAFDPADGIKNKTSFVSTPADEDAARKQFQDVFDQLRDGINALIDALEATTSGSSGAENIGIKSITGVTGATVAAQIASLKTLIDAKLSAVPDNSVTEAKIASGAVTNTKIGASAVGESNIETGAVTSSKIGTGAVTTAKLATGGVTLATLSSDVANGYTKIGTYANADSITNTGIYTGSSGALLHIQLTGYAFQLSFYGESSLNTSLQYRRKVASTWSDWQEISFVFAG